MTDKPERLPWDEEPWVNAEAATEKAIRAAQPRRVDPNSAAVQKWARAAFNDAIGTVKNAPGPAPGGGKGQRQDALFPNATSLYEIVAAGALDETEVYNALRDACRTNRLEQDDGETSVERTLVNARRKGFDNPRDLSHVGQKGAVDLSELTVDQAITLPLSEFMRLESGFWTSRGSLQTIYLAALARMCSPWAALAHCVARALTIVLPHMTLPPLIGGPGSLNWFAAVAANSGGGKSSAASVARELIPQPILCKNLGSGEGFIDAFIRPANKETGEPAGRHPAVMFTADEIDGMNALGQRNGSTLNSVIRSAFTGETLGFSYRTASNAHLESHSYRTTLVINVQPAKAGSLVGDEYGGTLQRFMWFPASDERVTSEPPAMPGQLLLPSHLEWQYPRELKVPYEAVELIRDERARGMRGERDALDGHALFVREKFAYGLAVIDGRSDMTLEDWRLAGIVSRVSDYVRTWVAAEFIRVSEEQATEKGRLHGVEMTAASEEKVYRDTQRLARIAQVVLKKITAATDGATRRDLTLGITSRDRPYLDAALERLQRAGRIDQQGKRWVKIDV